MASVRVWELDGEDPTEVMEDAFDLVGLDVLGTIKRWKEPPKCHSL